MANRAKAALSALAIFGVAAATAIPAIASKSDTDVGSNAVKEEASPGYLIFGHLPSSTEDIAVFAESAKVNVVRSTSAVDVSIASTCPHNWNLTGNTVRQAGFAKPRNGVAMLADALGSRAIVNGRIYPLPSGPIQGMQLGKDGVVIGGKKMEPLQGADMPGTCEGPDAVEIRVPMNFKGNLTLGVGNGSEVAMNDWEGGKVSATLLGTSNFSAGKLKSLTKAVVDLRGNGKAEIGDLSTKVLVANVSGAGNLTVKNGSADISNATVSGSGKIKLVGKYRNLKQAVEGQGSIDVSK